MNRDEILTACKAWIAGSISDEELRDETGTALTDEELEDFIFIGGDPELAENHAEILCDAIMERGQQ